jgi:hypothetical protein
MQCIMGCITGSSDALHKVKRHLLAISEEDSA